METTTFQIIDNSYFSNGFPTSKKNKLISRDNYLSQILAYLKDDNKIVFIEGDEDCGKTTLCAQFCKKNSKNSISVFFNPLNMFDFTIEYFYANVVSQIRNILGHNIEDIESEDFITVETYRYYLQQLRRRFKRGDENLYLIIDGLEDKISVHKDLIILLLDSLPLGDDFFKVIISGEEKLYLDCITNLKKIKSKTITLTGFTKHEIETFLEIESPIDSEIDELFKITKGYPGRLQTSKRLIKNHQYTLSQIIDSDTYNDWIELDCENIDLEDTFNKVVLSIIALTKDSFHIDDIVKITSEPQDTVTLKLEKLFVLSCTNSGINFISNSHKKFFIKTLRTNKKLIDDILVKYYSAEDTIKSKFELAKIYAESSQWSKIASIIDQDFLIGTIETTGNLQKANESIDIGFKASEEMNNFSDILKYSLQGSIVNELDNYVFWESEILARISLKDFKGAISLAESAVLKVDRLRLLALVARKEKQINNKVHEDLITLIQELYANTDLSSVGNVIYDIVSDLIYAIPNLAIEIIEKSSNSTTDKNINDWIVAKLSVAAINSSLNEDETAQNKALDAIQNLNNPSVRKINRAITFLVGNYSSTKVLEEVKKLSDSSERLKLLRLWLSNNNSHNAGVENVIDKALDELIVSSSESTLNLDVLKELSFQLANVKEFEIKKKLYDRFKTLQNSLNDLGLSKDKYIYELNIFHTEFTLNKTKSIPAIVKIISDIESIEDLLVQLESYCEVYAKIYKLHFHLLTKKTQFVYHRILELSHELLTSTADHYKICQNLLKTISKVNPILGLKICNQINTSLNRDRSRILLLDSYLDNNLRNVKIDFLKDIENSFENLILKQFALKNILERYAEAKNLHYNVIKDLFYFTNKIESIDIYSNRVHCYLLKYRIVAKNDNWNEKLSKSIKNSITDVWKKIEADWERIDAGFFICSEIAKIDDSFSKSIFEETQNQKKESWIDSNSIANTYLNSIQLVIRAYSGLIISESNNVNDYNILETLINRIPSEIKKLELWTEIGINTYLCNKHDITKKVYDNHILPLFQGLIYKNINIESALESLIIINHFNSPLTIDYLKSFSPYIKDLSCVKICDFYITNRSPFDIYEGEISTYNCTLNDILKAVTLLELVETDHQIYNVIDEIYKAITKNKNAFSRVQITDIANKLSLIIASKLPDLKNIKHNGYKIISEIKVELIKKQGTNWQSYIEETKNIPNLSDKLFVKAILLETLPFEKLGPSLTKKALFNEIIDDLDNLRSHYEFVDRVIGISEKMYEIDKIRWKKVVNKAFLISNDFEEGTEMYNYQKNIIDSMYRLDSEFAKELIKSIDKESKESKNAILLKKHYETLEVTKKIKNNQTLEQKEQNNHRMIIRAIIKAQGALNAGKINTKKLNEISKYLYIGNKLPLHEVFPIFMFYFSNCSKMIIPKNASSSLSDINRNNFEQMVTATNLIQLLSQRRKLTLTESRKFFIDDDFSTNMAVNPGSREEALAFIKTWMIEEVQDFIIFADPYFVVEDIEILKIIKEIDGEIDIDILGTDDAQKRDIEEEYRKYWNKISDEIPPFTNFTFCWVPEDNNNKPIHDRWIITKNGGLRLGTSFSSLGMKKESEISLMESNESLNILEHTLKEYISKKKKEINNQRISYKSFSF
jgi:hypothetical protein